MTQTYKYLHFIKYLHFHRWDVKAYAFQHKAFDNAVLLRDILTPYDIPLAKNEMLNNKWSIIAKINFSGKLFLRDSEETKTFKGNVHKVDGETLIYSKINVRHGCVYYHPKGAIPFGVSSEYPAYKINQERVNGDFLVLLLQSQYFKDALSAGTSGISKARVKPSVFLDIQIPLPSLEEQNKIVTAYNTTITQADNYVQQADDINDQIEAYLKDTLGIGTQASSISVSPYRFMSIYHYRDITNRWDINNVRATYNGKYQFKMMADIILRMSTGTTPPTHNKEYFNGDIDFYTPADINGSMYLEDAERHISQSAIKDNKARLFHKGDLLFVGIGSTVGKVGLVEKETVSSNQQITGITFNTQKVLPEYGFAYMHYFKEYTTADQSKTTLPIVNQEKIAQIPIPLPPLAIQNEIVNHITALRAEQKNLQQQASDLRIQATQQFEQTIFQ